MYGLGLLGQVLLDGVCVRCVRSLYIITHSLLIITIKCLCGGFGSLGEALGRACSSRRGQSWARDVAFKVIKH